MIRVLFILQQIFSFWMLVDAIRRGSRSYWFLVVLLPFGEWVYFFMVKIHDPEFEPVRAFFRRLTMKKVTVEELRYHLEQTPSHAANLALAQALYDKESYHEARQHFAEALRLHDGDREALYGLALSQSALQEHDAAIASFRQLIEIDTAFRDYAAWSDLAHVLSLSGRFEEAFEVLDTLVVKSPRLAHRVLYAHYLIEGGRRDAARVQIERGLFEHENAPRFIKKKAGPWVRRAKKMLKEL